MSNVDRRHAVIIIGVEQPLRRASPQRQRTILVQIRRVGSAGPCVWISPSRDSTATRSAYFALGNTVPRRPWEQERYGTHSLHGDFRIFAVASTFYSMPNTVELLNV